MYTVQPHYQPADQHTKQIVSGLVDKIDKRKARNVSTEALSELVSGCLALRGETFRINKDGLSEEHKRCVDHVKEALIGHLLQRKSQYTFTIHPSVPEKTFVVDKSEPNLKFRVQNEFCRWTNTASIPSADLVGTLSGRRAVKLVIPQVAETFEHLHLGNELHVRFESVPKIHPGLIAKQHATDYRDEITFWARKHGWLSVLIEDGSIDTYQFAVTDTHAQEFTEFLQSRTRKFFGDRGLPHLKFPSIIDTALGYEVTVSGFATGQHLQSHIKELRSA